MNLRTNWLVRSLLIAAAFLMIEGGGLTDLVGIATAVLAAGLQKKLGARQLAPTA